MSAVSAWQYHEHYVHKILSVLGREPARTVITTPNAQVTAEAFAESIFAAAAVLRSNEVAPGSTVAILTEPNHHRMLTIRYAAHLLGATTVYIRSNNARSEDDMLPAADQAHMLAEVGAALLVTDQANIGRGRELCQTLPCTAVVADPDRPDDPPGGTAGSPGVPFDARYEPGDRLVITYTSGTTGRPKGVCHSYRGWNTMAAGFEAVVRGSSPPTFLAVTPVSQTVGVMVDGTLAAGGSLVLHERFSSGAVLRDLAGLGITDCYLAVPHLYELTAALQLADLDLSKLRHVIYSGSPAAPHRMAEAARVFGRALLQSYGSTEAGPVTYLGAWEHRDADLLTTVGRPYPGVRLRVCQRDPRRPLPAGRTGEIWVRSGNLMEEYLSDRALTAKVLREGWLRTGDLGRLDDAGYLTLTGRIGDVIKNGGLRVYPATVERALLMHPDVSSAAVIGIRHRKDYEEAYAAVTLLPGAATTLPELRQHLGSAVSRAHAPAVLAVWAELPADESGKVDKRRLRALAEGGDCASHGLLAEE
jgi:fatty-acyl-CoA synthase